MKSLSLNPYLKLDQSNEKASSNDSEGEKFLQVSFRLTQKKIV